MTTFLRPKTVCERLGVSKQYLYRLIADGRFPAPLKSGQRIAYWPESTVEAWMRARIAEAAQ